MFGKLGSSGVAGILLLLGGIALIALENLIVAGGMALVLVGLLLVAKGLIGSAMEAFGMGGMF